MTSSTSSSDTAQHPWTRVWGLALVLAIVIVGSWEWLLRDAGLGPEYADNRSLWADTRHGLNQHGENAIALLGASRLQYAVDVATLRENLQRPVVQLAVEGTSALALLENLAVDPRFRGTVIYSVAPAFTLNSALPRIDAGKQREWVQYYLDQSRSRRMEQSLRLYLQGKLAFRSPDAKLPRVVPAILSTGSLPDRDQKTTFANRVLHKDYSKVSAQVDELGMVQFYLENTVPYTQPEFDVVLNYVDTLVRLLRRKGVDVYFLRLPSTAEVQLLESAFFPRQVFWDVMEHRLDATFIHADDYPQMKGFMSQDGSHIDSKYIVEFTNILSSVLRENGL